MSHATSPFYYKQPIAHNGATNKINRQVNTEQKEICNIARILRISTRRYLAQWLAQAHPEFREESMRTHKYHGGAQDDVGRLGQQIQYIVVKHNNRQKTPNTHPVTQHPHPTHKPKYIPTPTGRSLPLTKNQAISMEPDHRRRHVRAIASRAQWQPTPNTPAHHIRTTFILN